MTEWEGRGGGKWERRKRRETPIYARGKYKTLQVSHRIRQIKKESHRGLGVKHLGMLFTGLNLKEKSRDHLLK